MQLYGCFNVDISGPLTQHLKIFPKFSRSAELQPLRASRTSDEYRMRLFEPTGNDEGVYGVFEYV